MVLGLDDLKHSLVNFRLERGAAVGNGEAIEAPVDRLAQR